MKALLCPPSAYLPFRLSYFKRPPRRSFLCKGQKRRWPGRELLPETPNAELALSQGSPSCLHKLKKSQSNVITNQHWQSHVAHLFTMAVHAELSVQDSFIDASKALKAVPAFLLKKKKKEKKEGNITSRSDIALFFKGSVDRSRYERHFCSLLPYFLLS